MVNDTMKIELQIIILSRSKQWKGCRILRGEQRPWGFQESSGIRRCLHGAHDVLVKVACSREWVRGEGVWEGGEEVRGMTIKNWEVGEASGGADAGVVEEVSGKKRNGIKILSTIVS